MNGHVVFFIYSGYTLLLNYFCMSRQWASLYFWNVCTRMLFKTLWCHDIL